MNILQLTVHFSPNVGGVETHLDDLVEGLAAKNNNVTVLTYRPLVSKSFYLNSESRKNITIIRLPWIRGLFYRLRSPLLQFLYTFPGLFFVTPFIILKSNPEVIHAHGIVAGFIGVFWGNAFKKRTIVSTHSLYHFPKVGMYRDLVKGTFERANTILCLSKQSAREVENLGIHPKKVKVFTYWVDQEKFKPILNAKRTVGWDKKFVVFFVGRLVAEKGIPELLEAAEKWDKNITLAIAGSGPMENQINNLKLKIKNLEYLGKVEQDDLPKYYNASDLVIVPSTHDEGFGRVILEALSCGTPVIGSNRGAIPEAMDNTVGELINVSPENIKRKVESLYSNPEKLNKLSKNAIQFAKKRYSSMNLRLILEAYIE